VNANLFVAVAAISRLATTASLTPRKLEIAATEFVLATETIYADCAQSGV
jgi:hypothetical protein